MADPKFIRGQFVEIYGLAALRGRIVEVKPGFRKIKYRVRLLHANGQIKAYEEKHVILSKEQRWVY